VNILAIGQCPRGLRDNLSTDTNGLLFCVVEFSMFCINNLSVDFIGPPTIVPQASGSSTNIALGHANTLSVVERLYGGYLEEILIEEICKSAEKLATLGGGNLVPFSLKGCTSSTYGNVDILWQKTRLAEMETPLAGALLTFSVASWTEQITFSVL